MKRCEWTKSISNLPLNPVDNAFNGKHYSFTGSTSLYNMDLDVYNIQNNINIGIIRQNPHVRSRFCDDQCHRYQIEQSITDATLRINNIDLAVTLEKSLLTIVFITLIVPLLFYNQSPYIQMEYWRAPKDQNSIYWWSRKQQNHLRYTQQYSILLIWNFLSMITEAESGRNRTERGK
jgi:hypothetical protein